MRLSLVKPLIHEMILQRVKGGPMLADLISSRMACIESIARSIALCRSVIIMFNYV